MVDDAPAPRRGRPPRTAPAEPTGYRVTEALRRELDLARAFTGARTNQALIDVAVVEYLQRLRGSEPLFRVAAEALDEHLAVPVENVSDLAAARRRSR